MNKGDLWNGWTVDSLIGEGSFGKVYRVTRTEFGHTYESALKVIRIPQSRAELKTAKNEGMSEESVTSYFFEMVEDIVSEIALMSDLRGNSNIVSYEDHAVVELKDTFGWEIYIRMEMLTPLFDYLEKNTLTTADIIRMGTDLCRALEICQKRNIIHRDIKPENIFVSKQGYFKLGDFGIARQMEKTYSEMSKKGTYSYMAPEVYKGQPYNSTVDIYSLGIVLYRFLNNNRTPFLPPHPESIRYYDKQNANDLRMNGTPIPAPCCTNAKLADIVLKACAFDPKDRYASAEEMRNALEDIAITEEDNQIVYPPQDTVIAAQEISSISAIAQDPTVSMFDMTETDVSEDIKVESSEIEPVVQTPKIPEKKKPVSTSSIEPKQPSGNNKRLAVIAALIVVVGAAGLFVWQYFFRVVPIVEGQDAEKAKAAIENAGLEYSEDREFSEEVERNTVISQDHAQSRVKRGSEVKVVVSRGKAIEVPDLSELSKKKAKAKLEKLGLVLVVDSKKYSDTLKKNLVISQEPEPGVKCEQEDEIKVVISKGITQVEVPELTGMTVSEAEDALEKVHLSSSVTQVYSSSYSSGTVAGQSPEAGSSVDIYSKVVISESIGPQPVYRSSNGGGGSSKKTGKQKTDSYINKNAGTSK